MNNKHIQIFILGGLSSYILRIYVYVLNGQANALLFNKTSDHKSDIPPNTLNTKILIAVDLLFVFKHFLSVAWVKNVAIADFG